METFVLFWSFNKKDICKVKAKQINSDEIWKIQADYVDVKEQLSLFSSSLRT